ncbi:MAG: alpha/beta hydrolase [Clostridia bacterium]|nr:alpha/beta hydrolase [Clostridia bacterium]
MLYEKFTLGEKYPDASLTAYVCDSEPATDPRPAVIVCPGGGYGGCSPREAEPIVRRFFGEGFNVYLLIYSTGERAKDFNPLIEAALSIKLVRERAKIDNTNPEKIYIIGFSAGGHLAASAGTLWNIPVVRDAVGVTDGSAPEGINRPDGMILCYPVITVGELTHKGTAQHVTGHEVLTEEDIATFSLELNVDKTTPKTFLWHTFTDDTVPVENTLLFASALTKAGVPFEAHIFPAGPHGLSLCNKDTWVGYDNQIVPHAECWADLAVKWIRDF